ncbi:MAG TPA: IclR family transcriptional regulator [Steroidobacteraceae bacterium]|nr:IclR family transcriptional regulator [Steroidobacteraceae bacterium]
MKHKPGHRSGERGAQPESGDGLQSLQTAFRILDELSDAHGPVGLTDLALRLGELKPRVYRHLSTMKRLGVVFQDPRNGGYSLGGKLFTLGEAALEQFDLRFLAAPYLTRLRDETHQTALLSVPGNGEPIVLSCVEYRNRLSISSRPGNRPPPHCSSQGRIALAFADPPARERVLGGKLAAFTRHSITDRALIEQRLEGIRERFFEQAVDEVRLGINAVSAPLFRAEDELIGIIGIVGTTPEIGNPPPRSLIATLHGVAAALSAELNCRIYYERGLVK